MTHRARHALLALVVVIATVTTGGSASAQAEPPATGEPTVAPVLELVERPAWAGPEDQVSFVVAPTGDVSAATVQVEVFSALDSVEELEESATEDVGVRLSLIPPVPVAELPAGPDGTRTVDLRVSADPDDNLTTQLVQPGVHPVVISLLDAGGRVLDEIRTPLVRLADEHQSWDAPQLAVVLDVAAPPTLQPDGTRAISPERLEELVRVADVLAAHPDLDLTVAAVPDTLDALGAVDDAQAAAVLTQLAGRDVLAAPYLPLSAGSLVAAGLEGLIPRLLDRGTTVLTDRLGTDLRSGIWDGLAVIGDRAGTILSGLGHDRVLLAAEGDETPERLDEGPPPLVDSGPRPVRGTGPLRAIAVDPSLSLVLSTPLGPDVDAAHVALARLLLRSVEGDPGAVEEEDDDEDATTTVAVRPGALPERSVLAGLLDLLARPDSPVEIGGLELVDDEIDEDAEPVEPGALPRPELGAIAPRVHAASAELDTFEGMLGGPTPRSDTFRLQIATAVAATATADARDEALTTVEEALDASFAGVHLSGQTDLNLTSRQGTLPVTIENANPYPVEVLIRVRSDRLAFPEGDVLAVTVEEDLLRFDIPVRALATGSVPVFVELLSPDGQLELDQRRLNVRSTAFSGAGLVISLGALVVLVVWWARTWRRTRADA